ncbi:hypothetical protein NL676_032356 [Syzygium grande]|nr:hypothetical protein NL676_032356 [Syzygium grande]
MMDDVSALKVDESRLRIHVGTRVRELLIEKVTITMNLLTAGFTMMMRIRRRVSISPSEAWGAGCRRNRKSEIDKVQWWQLWLLESATALCEQEEERNHSRRWKKKRRTAFILLQYRD